MYRFLLAALLICCLSPVNSFAGLFSSDPLVLEVTSSPDGAKVYYAKGPDEKGTLLGSTPYTSRFEEKKYPAGYYRVEKKGYKTQTRLVAPPVDKPTNVKLGFTLQPITTINLNVTSKPSEATILFGTDRNNITKQLGNTPYRERKSDEQTEEKPVWEKGFYKAILAGYRPKVLAVEQSGENLDLNFDLEPLPQPPAPPRIEYPEAQHIAYKPVVVDAFKHAGTELTAATPIAIVALKESTGKDVGSAIVDALILKLQRKGYVVIEREIVEKTISDLSATQVANSPAVPGSMASATASAVPTDAPAPRKQSTGIELMKQIADQLKTRYFIIGTLGDYSSGKEEITLAPHIPDQEKERYQKEYDAYMNYFKSENMPAPQPLKTLKEWDQEYSSKTKSASLNVARVSITAKMLDIKSGKAVWTGMVNSSESALQKAVTKVVDAMVDSIAQ